MQGYDYGYSNVPSFSRRDRAITYRDYVLHDGLRKNDLWFPIANLMTHGIIKGHLQKLGGEAEPLDKYTDNAVLYFARGVAMWELYVSPNLLTSEEWTALTDAIRWAKDRFDILCTTDMVGGDPGQREPYGYLHFSGKRGIIAVRNPFMEKNSIDVKLSSSHGFDPNASSLVLERVYPTRWISPELYQTDSRIEIPLSGYETAVYEIYPLVESGDPLLCGSIFEVMNGEGDKREMRMIEISDDACFLNPENIDRISWEGQEVDLSQFKLPEKCLSNPVKEASLIASEHKDGFDIELTFEINDAASNTTLAVLMETDPDFERAEELMARGLLDDVETDLEIEQEKGQWAWIKIKIGSGRHVVHILEDSEEDTVPWRGKISAWLVCNVQPEPASLVLELKEKGDHDRPMLPSPWPAGTIRLNFKVGESVLPE
jgi:hypothetical protein